MFQNKGIAALFVTLILSLTGCATEYTYAPPTTMEGKQCVQQCQVTQGSCRNLQSQNALAARQQCESTSSRAFSQCETEASAKYSQCQQESQQDYNSCLKYASNRAICRQKSCFKETCYKPSCYQSADYGFCDGEFRSCYQNCGGTVGVMK